ncbi:MAG: hypothetical protein JJU36_06865 [Phycisphaeraceae bacterium]|nr:hypothetical protein [Phycisphaeraceae bacterium]
MFSQYYRLSGRLTSRSLPVGLGGTLVASVLLGLVYGLVVYWVPFIYVLFLATAGAGFAVGGIAYNLAIWSHTRNGLLVLAASVLGAVTAYVASFFSWVFVLADYDWGVLAPASMIRAIHWIIENGTWTLGSGGSANVSGLPLLLIWLGEFAIMLGVAVYIGWKQFGEALYCEETGDWIKNIELVGPFMGIEDPDDVQRKVEANDFSWIEQLRPFEVEEDEESVKLPRSFKSSEMVLAGSEATYLVTLRNVTNIVDKQGAVTRRVRPILRNLTVDRESFELIRQIGEQAAADPDSTEPAG